MDLYFSQRYLHVSECNKLNWSLNSALWFLNPNRSQLPHLDSYVSFNTLKTLPDSYIHSHCLSLPALSLSSLFLPLSHTIPFPFSQVSTVFSFSCYRHSDNESIIDLQCFSLLDRHTITHYLIRRPLSIYVSISLRHTTSHLFSISLLHRHTVYYSLFIPFPL